jgi:pyruvate/2-oxoacid:ferredoxin oxidoreductase beta subunit
MKLPEEREGVAQAGRACAGCLSMGVLTLLIMAALLWGLL